MLNKVCIVYFTTFPYQLYKLSNQNGNLAWSGISQSLIKSQQYFWLGNISSGIFLYTNNYGILACSFSLYLLSFKNLSIKYL